uniref:TM2 domain-containing protein n=1 Tax=termite gut metagenome TaxID=433724 RepID=S0DDE0_9ZZZZ
MKKNLLFTFCCACVPGFGQMYYGYMRRGTSLALAFWGIVFLASLSGLGVLGLFLPVLWAYAFFDTFNIRNLTPEQQAAFGDAYIPNHAWLRQTKVDRVFSGGNAGKAAGVALLVLGALLLYNTVFSRFLWFLRDRIPFLYSIIDAGPPLLVAVLVIVLGLRLVQGKPLRFGGKRDDDSSPYTGSQGFGQPYTGPRPFEHEGSRTYTPQAGENGSNFYASPTENLVNEPPAAEPPPVPVPPTHDVVLTLGDDVAVAAPAAEAADEAAAPAQAPAEAEKPKKKSRAKKAPEKDDSNAE